MSSRIQPQLLRQMTTRRILEVLQQQGPCSRAEITRLSGISAPTVSKAVASLLEAGLLEEGEPTEGNLGRPSRVLRLATDAAQVLGVVLDANRCWALSAGLDGCMEGRWQDRFPTPGTYESLMDALVTRLQNCIGDNGDAEAVATLGVGISIPGLVNGRTGAAVFSPNLHITDGHSPAQDLSERLGIECVMVQESTALCLAERMYGGAQDVDDFAMLDMTTGLGLGVFSGGQILGGHSGLAGELGHITFDPRGRLCGCGNHGCLETLATDSALARRVSERMGRSVDIDEVIEKTRSGEWQIQEDIAHTAEFMAITLSAAINLFNPATVFAYARFFEVQDGLFEHVVNLTRKRALGPSMDDCQIVQARGSKRQGAVAAIIQHLTASMGPSL